MHDCRANGSIYKQNITEVDLCQPLIDTNAAGRRQPWAEHKEHTSLLAYAYEQLGNDNKATRVQCCAPRLVFKQGEDDRMKLAAANFCRVRLCPVCQWRRSLKLFGQTTEVVKAIEAKNKVAWLMLTLTVKNVDGIDLPNEISIIHKAWDRLCKTKAFKSAALGWQRCLEVTHNTDINSSAYNTYHPHIHALVCVKRSYFKKNYIKRDEWAQMWASAARLDYKPQVWVSRVKDGNAGAVAEVTKYSSKPSDYITGWDLDLMTESVEVMDKALHRRRLVAFGGCMKEVHKSLGLDDVEDGDLIHTDNDNDADAAEAMRAMTAFEWVPGYRQYFKAKG